MDRLKELLENDKKSEQTPVNTAAASGEAPTEVEVYAFSIEEALKNAASAMGVSIVNLEYEILEKGEGGFLGIGRKPHRILIKQSRRETPNILQKHEEEALEIHPTFMANQDGKFKVMVRQSGVMLRVEPPKGSGRRIELREIQHHLSTREIPKFMEDIVSREVNKPSGQWVKIWDYHPSPYDSKVQVNVAPDEMKAYMTMTKPEKYGRVLEVSEIRSALKAKNVFYGIKEKIIEDAIENDLFNISVCVAEGDPAVDGKDSEIKYHFKTDLNRVGFQESEDGSVDFHKLDIVQSVVVGQILATRVPSQRGKAGKSVTGRVMPSKDGRDIPLLAGVNTHLSPDGSQLIADINGQVQYKNSKVNVEPILEITGDVDLSSGDINFPGNVIIYGNVNDTFKVYSGLNIEIKGHIGKADVVAEGNIIVRQGIQGKDAAKIVCGGDMYARFVERATLKVTGYVYVTEAIMHSNIDCKNKVICHGGKKSQIVGGLIRALYEVNAKNIGAESYNATVIEVGTDPEKEERLVDLHKRKDEIVKDLPEVTKQLNNLSMMMSSGTLPPEKQDQFNILSMQNRELKEELLAIDEEIKMIQEYMDGLGKDAKVSASNIVYPGVKIRIKKAFLEVRNEFKQITFSRESAGTIKPSPYEKSKEIEDKTRERPKDIIGKQQQQQQPKKK